MSKTIKQKIKIQSPSKHIIKIKNFKSIDIFKI